MPRMRLTLVLPGLLWPRQALIDSTFDLDLPALACLLGRGQRTLGAGVGLENWLAQSLGLSGWPAAAWRARAAGVESQHALCLDAAHLSLGQSAMSLDPVSLDAEESQALAADLAPMFADLGDWHQAAPGQWLLRLNSAPDFATTPLPQALGRDIKSLLPRGEAARPWQKRLMEAEMTLHGHAVNRARLAGGRAEVNTLWLWGEGALEAPLHAPFSHAIAENAIPRGFAASYHMIPYPALADVPTGPGHTLAIADDLHLPSQRHDALAWREALNALEQDWFAPLLTALDQRRLESLNLVALGDHASLTINTAAGGAWKFWRKPLPLAHLAEELP